ncbi:MAG TPA: hypothetical protein VN181_02585 [Thermoanaerobaculia bacterium]|nr:hypothetical protein [Thermoanaerobaculia bacterium]
MNGSAPTVPAPYMQQVPQQYTPPPPPLPANDPRIRGYQPPAVQSGQKQYVTGKSVGVAVLLSFLIPGLGQFYNNDVKKGLVMLLVTIFTGGILWLPMWIWSMIDASNVASGKSPIW